MYFMLWERPEEEEEARIMVGNLWEGERIWVYR